MSMVVFALIMMGLAVAFPFAIFFGYKWGWALGEWMDRHGWLD
jgi:hypothetical protein